MIQVRVSSQPTRIETSTQAATLTLQSQPPAQLEITSAAAKLEISQPQGTLTIDGYPSRAAIGLKNTTDMLVDFAQYGRQAVQELTAKYVQDGNRLADITNAGSSVGHITAEHNVAQPLDITWAYVPLPDIRYQMNPPEFTVTPGQLTMSAQPVPVQGDYTPGSVDTRVTQYASISITTAEAGNTIDIQS
jgi:hypothetical protein